MGLSGFIGHRVVCSHDYFEGFVNFLTKKNHTGYKLDRKTVMYILRARSLFRKTCHTVEHWSLNGVLPEGLPAYPRVATQSMVDDGIATVEPPIQTCLGKWIK